MARIQQSNQSVLSFQLRGVGVRRSKLALVLAVALAGGSLPVTCQTRFRDALVSGARSVVFNSLLDPLRFVETLTGGGDGVDAASQP